MNLKPWQFVYATAILSFSTGVGILAILGLVHELS